MRGKLALFLVCALLVPRLTARAFTTPFARFTTTVPGTTHYLSAGALFGHDVPVHFEYLPAGVKGEPLPGFGVQDADLSLLAFRVDNAQSLLGVGRQGLRLYSFSIKLDTPLDGKSNLLSGIASTGELRGLLGSGSAAYASSTEDGASLGFTSDFLRFQAGKDADLTWVLTGISPPLDITGPNFRAFDSGITGTFGYGVAPASVVPEGSSLWLLCAGGLPLLWGLLRLRRAR